MARRFNCPICGKGINAPERMRKDDARRYCLPCTGKTGKLVEREAPALKAKRETSRQRSQTKVKTKAQRAKAAEAAKFMVAGQDIRKLIAKAGKLPALKPAASTPYKVHRAKANPAQASGRAWGYRWHATLGIDVTLSSAMGVVLHEMAHCASYRLGEPWLDADAAFGRRLSEAIEQWNKLGVCEVSEEYWGAYRGRIGRANVRRRKNVKPELKPERRAAPDEQAKRERAIKWEIKHTRAEQLARKYAKPGMTVLVPPAAWTEFVCMVLEVFDRDEPENATKLRMAEWVESQDGRKLILPDDMDVIVEFFSELSYAVNFHYESAAVAGERAMWMRIIKQATKTTEEVKA